MLGDLVRVGRWMSRQEYDLMLNTGFVQESSSGTIYVASPADRTAYQVQAVPGSFYVEFDVPADSIRPTQQGWAKMLGPNTLEGRQAIRSGKPVPKMPPSLNMQHRATK